MSDLITQYTRKPARYRHLDGTVDLGLGVWLLAWAISFRISQGNIAFLVASAVAWVVVHFGTRYIRRRLLYPRAGYIKPQKRYWALALAVCLAAVAGLFFSYAKPRSVLIDPLMIGLLVGVTLLVRASIDRLRRLVALAMVSVAIGLALQFIGPRQTPELGMSWYFLLMGTAFLISGALTLRSYVRRMPPRDLEAE